MKKKNELEEIREVFIECSAPGNAGCYEFKGYMKKTAEYVSESSKYAFYEGFLRDGIYDDCVGFCVKKRNKDEKIEYTDYCLFPKKSMKDPVCVELKRDTRNGNIENYGSWGYADFYGIDNAIYFDIAGEVYSHDVLVKEENVKDANKFLSEKEGEFSKIMADPKKNSKYYQFKDHYEQGILDSINLTNK